MENFDTATQWSYFYEIFSSSLTRAQFVAIPNHHKLGEIYASMTGATKTRRQLQAMTEDQQLAEIYLLLDQPTYTRRQFQNMGRDAQFAAMYIATPGSTLTQRQFKGLSRDKQMARLFVIVDAWGGSGSPLAPPANTALPSISDTTPTRGQTLTRVAGTWTGNPVPTLTYEWFRDNDPTAIGTATTQLVPDEAVEIEGATEVHMKVIETATNSQGGASADSVVTSTVVAVPFAVALGIQGTETIPAPIAVTGIASCRAFPPPTYAYEWFLNDVSQGDPGASIDTSGLSPGDEIKVGVIATNSEGSSAQVISNICTLT